MWMVHAEVIICSGHGVLDILQAVMRAVINYNWRIISEKELKYRQN